jgi:hypothetical protein
LSADGTLKNTFRATVQVSRGYKIQNHNNEQTDDIHTQHVCHCRPRKIYATNQDSQSHIRTANDSIKEFEAFPTDNGILQLRHG